MVGTRSVMTVHHVANGKGNMRLGFRKTFLAIGTLQHVARGGNGVALTTVLYGKVR